MGETDIVGRLWGWCRDPKTKLQTRLKRLGFSVKPTHLEEVVLPLLFDIGTFLWLVVFGVLLPVYNFLPHTLRILSFGDLMVIGWVGVLLYLNRLTIYTYRHHASMSRRSVKASKLILLVTDTVAIVGVLGWVFQLPRELTTLAGFCLMLWRIFSGLRFFPIEEKDRPKIYKQLYGKSFFIKTGRKISQKIRGSKTLQKMKAALGEPHYH